MTKLIAIDPQLLSQVSEQAKQNVRRRRHHNFHHADTDLCHRLLNAMEPDSYIAPHCHADPSKDETIIALRGKFGVIMFSPAGDIEQLLTISPTQNTGVTIPHEVWHSLVCLEPDSVFFECKAGPYLPLTELERATWAPAENAPGAQEYLARLRELFAD